MSDPVEVYARQDSPHSGPRDRTIVGLVVGYLLSYLMPGLFQLAGHFYAMREYIAPFPAGGISYPDDGPYIIVFTVSLFVPLALGGTVLGWMFAIARLFPHSLSLSCMR
jgi:hypothetical protein